jgi:hypothetical protein
VEANFNVDFVRSRQVIPGYDAQMNYTQTSYVAGWQRRIALHLELFPGRRVGLATHDMPGDFGWESGEVVRYSTPQKMATARAIRDHLLAHSLGDRPPPVIRNCGGSNNTRVWGVPGVRMQSAHALAFCHAAARHVRERLRSRGSVFYMALALCIAQVSVGGPKDLDPPKNFAQLLWEVRTGRAHIGIEQGGIVPRRGDSLPQQLAFLRGAIGLQLYYNVRYLELKTPDLADPCRAAAAAAAAAGGSQRLVACGKPHQAYVPLLQQTARRMLEGQPLRWNCSSGDAAAAPRLKTDDHIEKMTRAVKISNVAARRDATGQLMDVHDGNIVREPHFRGGAFLWWGMGYQNCTESTGPLPPFNCPAIYQPFGGCGFRDDHAVRLYASRDLVSWELVASDVLPPSARPTGVYFRPKVVYNRHTRYWVLWVNFLDASVSKTPLKAEPTAKYVVATSLTPEGPFRVWTEHANVEFSGGGDFALLVDGPNAFLAYDSWQTNHKVVIEQLDANFTSSLGPTGKSSGPISKAGQEAPILFARGGLFFLLFGPCCCFCAGGSGSSVFTAQHPLGPWTDTGQDLNPTDGQGTQRAIRAQENFVVTVPTVSAQGTPTTTFLYTGDRWASAPDHLKSHDFQYWQPLSFNDSTSPPSIAPLKWVDSFHLTLNV